MASICSQTDTPRSSRFIFEHLSCIQLFLNFLETPLPKTSALIFHSRAVGAAPFSNSAGIILEFQNRQTNFFIYTRVNMAM